MEPNCRRFRYPARPPFLRCLWHFPLDPHDACIRFQATPKRQVQVQLNFNENGTGVYDEGVTTLTSSDTDISLLSDDLYELTYDLEMAFPSASAGPDGLSPPHAPRKSSAKQPRYEARAIKTSVAENPLAPKLYAALNLRQTTPRPLSNVWGT